ncbi:MAG: hypothetical protein LQ346_008769, partial [Caloplaca aetnensis]
MSESTSGFNVVNNYGHHYYPTPPGTPPLTSLPPSSPPPAAFPVSSPPPTSSPSPSSAQAATPPRTSDPPRTGHPPPAALPPPPPPPPPPPQPQPSPRLPQPPSSGPDHPSDSSPLPPPYIGSIDNATGQWQAPISLRDEWQQFVKFRQMEREWSRIAALKTASGPTSSPSQLPEQVPQPNQAHLAPAPAPAPPTPSAPPVPGHGQHASASSPIHHVAAPPHASGMPASAAQPSLPTNVAPGVLSASVVAAASASAPASNTAPVYPSNVPAAIPINPSGVTTPPTLVPPAQRGTAAGPGGVPASAGPASRRTAAPQGRPPPGHPRCSLDPPYSLDPRYTQDPPSSRDPSAPPASPSSSRQQQLSQQIRQGPDANDRHFQEGFDQHVKKVQQKLAAVASPCSQPHSRPNTSGAGQTPQAQRDVSSAPVSQIVPLMSGANPEARPHSAPGREHQQPSAAAAVATAGTPASHSLLRQDPDPNSRRTPQLLTNPTDGLPSTGSYHNGAVPSTAAATAATIAAAAAAAGATASRSLAPEHPESNGRQTPESLPSEEYYRDTASTNVRQDKLPRVDDDPGDMYHFGSSPGLTSSSKNIAQAKDSPGRAPQRVTAGGDLALRSRTRDDSPRLVPAPILRSLSSTGLRTRGRTLQRRRVHSPEIYSPEPQSPKSPVPPSRDLKAAHNVTTPTHLPSSKDAGYTPIDSPINNTSRHLTRSQHRQAIHDEAACFGPTSASYNRWQSGPTDHHQTPPSPSPPPRR